MKKRSLVLMLLLFAVGYTYAQRTITGVVTDQNGEALIGASVLVKNTSAGTVTDIDGSYTLEIATDQATLVFSYTGFSTQEVETGNSSIIDITLAEGVTLNEAVVTALGIEREKKALGYAVQEVDGSELTSVADQNVVSSLTGKVAGVQIISASGASLGGTAKIRIRGANSLNGGSPLFVVDGTPISNANFSDDEVGSDYGNLSQDIPPEDIESISVLKGPAATAIYGQRGADGVVMITTKKGRNRKGIGVTYSGSVTGDKVYVLPEYQDEYAGGYTQDFLQYTDAEDGQTYNGLNYAADESWGPKMDGRDYRPWWSWFPGEDYGKTIPLEGQPDNVRDFFDTGITYNNNIALSGGNETSHFRVSYTNINQSGIMPNSKLKRNNLSLNAGTELAKRLTLNASVTFANTNTKGRPAYGYSPARGNVIQGFNQWFQRQLNMDRLQDYKFADGTTKSWNIRSPTNLRPLYWDSPYWTVNENYTTDSRDRYFGNVNVSYQIADGLSVTGYLRRDNYTQRYEERIATGGLELDSYEEFVANGREDNYELVGMYNKTFGKLSIDATLAGNIRKNDYHSNRGATAGGLNAPNLFNLGASVDRPTSTSFTSEKVVRSVYGSANFGWNSLLYLGFTIRNDWSSALPEAHNSYLYPSVQGSFVFSELMNSNLLSFGKIRASFAQVGSDIGPYETAFTYGLGTPYGSTPTFNLPNNLVNEDLKPALSSSYEAGLELKFFRNRLGLDMTVYRTDSKDQILSLAVPGSSGFSSALINAGNIRSEGLEITLMATPVQTRDFTWDIIFNAAKNNSQVLALADGLDNYRLDGWGWGGFSINAPVGEEWGMMRGRGFDKIDGKPILNENGTYKFVDNQDLGGVLPDWTGGLRNELSWKGIDLSFFLEFQKGGQFHSVTRMFNAYSGLALETAGLNDKGTPVRDPVDIGGGVRVDGVDQDGNDITKYVDPQLLYSDNLFAFHERWIYDASYLKLREVAVGYTFPGTFVENTPFTSLRLSVIGRNLWLIKTNVAGIDPSEITPGNSNYVYQENGILPGVRSIGLNLRLGF